MTDLPLFADAAPLPPRKRRRSTADTSSVALDRVRPVRSRQQQVVLDTLRAYGRLTRHALADSTGLPLSSVCGRVAELIASGDVREAVVNGRKLVVDGRHVIEPVIPQTQRGAA